MTISFAAAGQGLERSDLIKITEVALDQGRLPRDLIINRDRPMLVIRSENETENDYSVNDPRKINIWSDEQIFLVGVEYWMIPTSVTRTKNKAEIKYRTTNYAKSKNDGAICYEGQIVARMKKGTWTLAKSAFTATECDYDMWVPKK